LVEQQVAPEELQPVVRELLKALMEYQVRGFVLLLNTTSNVTRQQC
jgi:hypothetical protein